MSEHLPTGLTQSLSDERLWPFLPLVYTAWSDGELSDDEIEAICALIAGFDGIADDCRLALQDWLDPERPPTPDELELLRRQVAEWVSSLGISPTASVGEIGVAIAGRTRIDHHISSEEQAVLADIEERFGPLPMGPNVTDAPARLADIATREVAFDVAELSVVLDGRYRAVRNRMRAVLARPEFAYAEDLPRDEYRDLVLQWTQMLADEGFGSLAYPSPYGEDDTGSFVAALAMLGHHDLSLLTKFGVQFGLFGGSIAWLGTSRHHERYLADAGSLALPGCFAMTETAHGSNVRDLETIADYDPTTDELVITTPRELARKDYIGNAAAHGRLAVVFARLRVDETDHGVHAALVPIRDQRGRGLPGVRVEDNATKGGLNGVDNGRIWFDGVRVPRSALLDRFASISDDGTYVSDIPNPDRRFFTTIGTLVGGRVGVGAASVSVAKSALTIALRYAHRRRQFGPAAGTEVLLIDYALHRQRLIPRLAATYGLHFAFESLIADYADETSDHRRLEARAAGLKALASWHAIDTAQAAREASGGQGFLATNRLTTMRADADVFTTYEGDNTVLLLLVAKSLLSDFGQQFDSMNAVGLVRYLARRIAETLAEASPVTRSVTEEETLTSATWQLGQLERRRDHKVASLARRIKHRIDDGVEPFEAFAQVQTHALDAARSHVEHHVLERFADEIERLDSGPLRGPLDRLRALHGLATIREDLGWFQQHNVLTSSTAHAVAKAHDALVADVARDSLALVDAFAIPDQVLAAPIAARYPPSREEPT